MTFAQPASNSVTLHEGTNLSVSVSPDGASLAIDLQGVLWILPSAGGTASPITDRLGDSRQPHWSPDGRTIAFQSYRDGAWHIWLASRDGTDLRQITFGDADDREPYWHPDGGRIAFSSDRAGSYDIWEIQIASGNLSQKTMASGDEFDPAWSDDGQTLAYVGSNASNSAIYSHSAKGVSVVVPPSSDILRGPSWGPDGSSMSYARFTADTSELWLVQVTDAGDKGSAIVTEEDIFPFRTSWANDTQLYYSGNGVIQRRQIADSSVSTIPFAATLQLDRRDYKRRDRDFDSTSPSRVLGFGGFSVAQDNRIVLAALGDLWLLDSDGKLAQLSDDNFIQRDPVWSVDGSRIAYVNDRSGSMQVWVRDSATQQNRRLTDLPGYAYFPSWSPDGKHIAFLLAGAQNVWGASSLWLLNTETHKTTQLAADLFAPSRPSWSAAGEHILISLRHRYSSRFREGRNGIFKISINGGNGDFLDLPADLSVDNRGRNGPLVSPDGRFIALVTGGLLHTMEVNADLSLIGEPRLVSANTAEMPVWFPDSSGLLFLAVDEIHRVGLRGGHEDTIDIPLKWSSKQSKQEYVIRAGRLFDGTSDGYQYQVDIRVKGNRIVSISPAREPSSYGGLKLIDASDRTVLPGLIDMHAHQSTLVGERLGRIFLAFGITVVREPGADPYDALLRKELWTSGKLAGPRLFFAGRLFDGRRPNYANGTRIESKAELSRALNRAARLNFDLIKTYVRLPDDLQQQVVATAHRLGIPVTSHEIFPAAGFGVDAVEHLSGTSRRGYSPKLSHGNRMYADVIQLLAKSNMSITPTLALQGGLLAVMDQSPELIDNRQYVALFPESERQNMLPYFRAWFRYSKITTDIRNLQTALVEMAEAGVRITSGTDAPLIPYGLSLHIELMSYVDAGMSPAEALRTATSNAAEAIGVGDQLGSIEPGKLADLVIVDGDPVKDIMDTLNIQSVIKNGSIYTLEELLIGQQ